MVRAFSIVQCTVVDHQGFYRKHGKKFGVVAEICLLKRSEGVLHQ